MAKRKDSITIQCYCDADHGGCYDTRRSTTGFMIIANDMPVVWKAQRQKVATTSTCSAELTSASAAANKLIWVRNFFKELQFVLKPTPVHIDNLSTINSIKNNQVHEKTAQLDIKLHFIRDINHVEIEVEYIPTDLQLADCLTKPLAREKFNKFVSQLMNMPRLQVALLAMVICALLPSADSFLLRAALEIEPRQVVWTADHACELVMSPMEELAYKNTLSSGSCKSRLNHYYEQCVEMHAHLMKIYTQVPSCARSMRSKRSTMSSLYDGIIELPKILGAATSMWLRGTSTTALVDSAANVASQLLRELQNDTHQKCADKQIVPFDITQLEISQVSRFAGRRPEVLSAVVHEDDYRTSFIEYYTDEMRAAEVLLRSICNYLKEGRMDTQSFGELIDDDDLMSINPIDTIVKSITSLNRNNTIIEFRFDVFRKLSLMERIIWTDLLASILGMVIVAIASFAIYVPKQRDQKDQNQRQNVVVQRLPGLSASVDAESRASRVYNNSLLSQQQARS